MNRRVAIALLCTLTCAAFTQTASRPEESSGASLVWKPIPVIDLDVLPKATVPKLMITKLRVSDLTIVLEQTELEAIQAHFGGEIGSEGDASESLGWLCLHGSDAVGRWVLWLESGEIDGPTVGGFQWRRVPDAVQFDERCRRLPDTSSNVEMPIELRLGATETKVLQILGQPTVRKGDTLIYAHEHEESLHNEPYTSTNTVTVVLRYGGVWAIEVHKTTLS
jgi:hypothetical protein